MITIRDTPLAARSPLPEPRAGGVEAGLEPAFLPTADGALRAKLRHPEVVAVTTGQQPGLFTGPLYTIHKALSARGLALALERRWQRPVVPVFWLAGDDHDHAEAAPAHWLTQDGRLTSVALAPRASDGPQRPLYREPLPAEIDQLLDRLHAELPEGPPREQTVAWLRRHYRPGATIAGAYGAALNELLTSLGVLCFDPTHPAAKQSAAELTITALRRTDELDRALVARMAALQREGIDPDVKVGDGASLVFLETSLGRDRLVATPGGFRTRRGGETWTLAALEELSRREPERFSPNVVLRPVVESRLLPTVAYLAGPGELRYLALAEALYQPLGVTRQLPVPRWSGVLVEARVERTLAKFSATLDEALDAPAAVEDRMVRTTAPKDFDAAFAETRRAIDAGFTRIETIAHEIDPTMQRPAEAVKAAALTQLAGLEKRLLTAQRRRQGELVAQWERVQASLRPLGQPQERVLGLVSFLGRYGRGVLEQLADHIAAWYA